MRWLDLQDAWRRISPMAGVTLLLASVPARAATEVHHEDHPAWVQSGNALQFGIPLLGLGLTYLLDDEAPAAAATSGLFAGDEVAPGLNWPGPRLEQSARHDFVVSFLRMEVATYAIKYALNTKRPNGGRQSFPSGHSSAAFMGAEFMRKHYGEAWGLPAYAAASWVGYTRVESHNHYWYDVLGGALLGIASNHDFDALPTPLGTLHVRLGLMGLDTSLGDSPNQAFRLAPQDVPPPAPALQLQWYF